MAGFVVCAACGARIKAGRIRCLRCGEELRPLEPAGPQRPSVAGAALKIVTLVVGSSVALLALVATVWQTRREPPPRTAPAVRSARSSSATVHAPPTPGAAAQFEPATALDARRAGTASFGSGDFEAARASYEKAVAKNPNDAEALNGLGQSLVRLGRTADAVTLFERAVAVAPDTWVYRFNLAHAVGQLGQWDRAVDEYRRAVQLFPDDYATQCNLAMALHKKGDEQAAIPEFQKAIALAPSEPTFHISLGLSFEKLGRIADAVREYRVFLAMDPDSPDAPKLKSHVEALTAPNAQPAKPS